jgi:DNA polymerase-3 subunit delta'
MLDDYKNKQPKCYKILTNSLNNNKYSHAYLFEINGYDEYEKFIIGFVKSLLCPFSYTNLDKCNNCHQCENVDKNIYPELKIINPEGMWIKKEELLELKESFQTKSLQSNKKVYIIYQAEKLNTSSANSILKFLEEPEDNIVAILVTENIHQILPTIISRCQIISMNPTSNEDNIINFFEKKYLKEELDQRKNDVVDFIDALEKNYMNVIVNEKNIFFDKFIEKEDIIDFYNFLILFYKDVINFKLNRKLELYNYNDISTINKNNDIELINKKLQILLTSKKCIKINANTNLLLDKLIIDLGGVK